MSNDDTTLQESVEAELNQQSEDSDEESAEEEPSDGELLDAIENEEEAKKPSSEIDQIIASQSDEAQVQFLKGGIPKVVFKHAMKECDNASLALTLLEISFELNNAFVEKFILDSILEDYGDV